ncbi:ABC transporter permease [Miniphocaeibacter massiliensis]|uniref:ABC transporter permease n=1 Tax=Miniphocaeibacter massiliensis TaxID=2041841 RepID=UPI000C1C49BA|nr:ABC transporter permease [Miniphocaeibacter massiliensis]
MNGFLIIVEKLLQSSIKMAAPLTFVGIGESISEKSGILNIGVEGMMLTGAFSSFIIYYFTGNLLLGILMSMVISGIIGIVQGFLAISCKGNQTIIGLAINFLLLGVTSFIFLMFFGDSVDLPSVNILPVIKIPLLSSIPIIGKVLFHQDILVYILYAIISVSCFIFYKTEWGVQLEAVGENPSAADTAGLNIFRIRYLACFINGILCGLGGAYMTVSQFGFFSENITAGRGYIALAAVTLGRRNPALVFCASLVIGFTESLQYTLQSMNFGIPSQVFTMLPYIIAVVVLLLSIGKDNNPRSLGIPYDRNER